MSATTTKAICIVRVAKKSIFSLQTGVYIQAKGRFGLPENKA